MEETKKVQGYLDAYLKAIKHAEEAKSVREIDAAKLEGHKAYIDLSHQVNRITPEFARLCRQRRTELTLAHYKEIENRTPDNSVTRLNKLAEELQTLDLTNGLTPETLESVSEPVVVKKPVKKAKKAKK